ncbi:E1-E2 ATPase [Streptococcus ictaluri 707-05]|uniref:P-type Cu(+) transporter n=1 Tax=Streptococcus ictaluri 707-05 TaxID=764299 RepID=G5K480_9STRE|nr:E1-E2 ATPase [Streptococcus ictaluri 707-05]
MDSLVALATTFAFLYSLYSLYQIVLGVLGFVHHLYFESVVVILTLITLGKYLESQSKGRTSQAIKKLMSLTANEVRVLRQDRYELIPIEEVTYQDIILVQAGEKIAVDGEVLEGQSSIDESLVTGESLPVDKEKGDKVFAGTINGQTALTLKPTKLGNETLLAQIINLVENAQQEKAPIAAIADKVSGIFVPIILLLALITALFWMLIMKENLEFALTRAIAVLVIACPCALGLATPTAIMVGSGTAAEKGILFKGGHVLEKAHQVDTIVFDKTGTITEGKPALQEMLILSGQKERILQEAASIEQYSQHPLGQAIVSKAKEEGQLFLALDHFQSLTGLGLEAVIDGCQIWIGNKTLMSQKGIDTKAAD